MSEKQDQRFLQQQLEQFEIKLTRLQNARESSDGDMEAKTMDANLHTAHQQYQLLQALLDQQQADDAPELDTVLEQQIRSVKRTLEQASQGWHKGKGVPAAYWEAQQQQAFLIELRQDYHQWNDPAAPAVEKSSPDDLSPGNPWDVSQRISSHLTADDIVDRIAPILHTKGLPPDHLHIVVEHERTVAITGIVHDQADLDWVSKAILAVEGVSEVLTDVETIHADNCPICRARGSA
ncbi:MAG TPA: hypothetical protein VHP83_20335 [Aggregatilineaceae bacterium]|nr:hypothetical protein [Aggregatilineaceae bacterium]